MKRLLMLLVMIITVLSFATVGFAENGAPIYNNRIDDKTSYSSANDMNIAMVRMEKANYTEEYEIQFFKDYFVVLFVSADDSARMQSLQSEVGVKQEYGPNPRVNSVKNALENSNQFPRSLENSYIRFANLENEEQVRALANKVVGMTRPELGSNYHINLVHKYRPEYFGAKETYVFTASNAGFDFAKYVIDAKGFVEVHYPNENGVFMLKDVFQYDADGRLIHLVQNSNGVYVEEGK